MKTRRLACQQVVLTAGTTKLCQPFNLTIHAGEIWGILGANGSGKTTLLHTLAGLQPTAQGDIFLNDTLLAHLTPKNIARSIGLLFQTASTTFAQSVWAYCESGRYPHTSYFQASRAQDHAIISHALQQMDLLPLAQQSITRLSGGEQRRLALATVIAQTPDIFLLDEPTNHLDLRYVQRIMQYFQTLAKQQGKVVVMALHDLNLAQAICDYILLLKPDGTIEQGDKCSMLTAEKLSFVYGCQIVKDNKITITSMTNEGYSHGN